MRALVDTSFLLRAVELGMDLLARVEDKLGTKIVPVVVPEVVKELTSLAKGKNVRAKRAGLALILCETLERLDTATGGEGVDFVLLRRAKELGLPVLTCDSKLMRSLRRAGVGVIYVDKKGEVRVEATIL